MKRFAFALLASICCLSCHNGLFKKKTPPPIPTPVSDTIPVVKAEPKKKKESRIKPYAEILGDEAKTDSGLIIVHKVDGKFLFELQRSMLDREILVVSRIAGYVKGLNFGGAGMNSRGEQVIRWEKLDDRILLRSVSYNNVASEEDPVYRSVRNNNFEPVIASYDIQAYNADTTAYLIDVSSLFTSDVPMIGGLSDAERKNFEISGLDDKRSFVESIRSFPQNVEVRHILTYKGNKLPDNNDTKTLSLEMNQSFIVLPEKPMMPRFYDARVGYFSLQQTDYSDPAQRANTKRYITRWRLEPKNPAAYARGELVEPVKPIVYYIDPATPVKWRKYIKQGVEDWQKAFEEAGFKKAILAKDPPSPEEDPDWSPEDARYSVIRYITTDIQNAVGPHIHDPRSGEILESDILWYHNIMNLLRNWFFIQTAAYNPAARNVEFEEALMGTLMRFVAAHEVGHTLGLPHNMGASSAYPVDSLRSASFTQKMGTAPSIMDYARFNYIAQPGDEGVALMPAIGLYDKFSIRWGYRQIPGAKTPEAERDTLNAWVKEKAGDPIYRFGQQRFVPLDPSAQTEDLGDDPVKASQYGIENLKRIVPNLIQWSGQSTRDFEQLQELYGQVTGQFNRYMGHVAANIGGVYEHKRSFDENSVSYTPVPGEKQKESVEFICEQLFDTPEWLIDTSILRRIESNGIMERIMGLQSGLLNTLFSPDRLSRLMEQSALQPASQYGAKELIDDLSKYILKEVTTGKPIDPYRRNLQRAFIEKVGSYLKTTEPKLLHSDLPALARGYLVRMNKNLIFGIRVQGDEVSRLHLEDLQARIKSMLDPRN